MYNGPLGAPPNEVLVPSINFAMVCPGVYRSGYPTKKNFRFLKALRLRSICYLCPEDYAESNLKFCEENNIRVLRFPTEGNKEPFLDISELLMHRILTALCDTRNQPLLIHCNKGKHRTGTVVACLRLLQGWSLVSVFDEYRRFAGDKARVGDQQYIELYRPIVMLRAPYVPEWVAPTPRITVVLTEDDLERCGIAQLGGSLLAGADAAPAAAPLPPKPSAEEPPAAQATAETEPPPAGERRTAESPPPPPAGASAHPSKQPHTVNGPSAGGPGAGVPRHPKRTPGGPSDKKDATGTTAGVAASGRSTSTNNVFPHGSTHPVGRPAGDPGGASEPREKHGHTKKRPAAHADT